MKKTHLIIVNIILFTVVFSFNDRIEDWRQILGNRCI